MKATAILRTACAAAMLLAATAARTSPDSLPGHRGDASLALGFVVNAEARFDPLIQRLMAERSLKALPLEDGQLFYIVPVNVDPRLEEMQIRYLELLIDKARRRDELEPSTPRP